MDTLKRPPAKTISPLQTVFPTKDLESEVPVPGTKREANEVLFGITAFYLLSGLLDYSIHEMLPFYAAALILAIGSLIYTNRSSHRFFAATLCLVTIVFLCIASWDNSVLKEPFAKMTCLAKLCTH